MTIIKEFRPPTKNYTARCVIRTNTYAGTLGHLNKLFTVAKEDFPRLDMEDVEVIFYAGRRYARTYGIEFWAEADDKIPSDYRETNELELTY